MTDVARPFANPLLQVSEFDSDASKPMVLCVVPSANEPVRLAFPALYMDLVAEFDGRRTEEEAIDAFLARYPDRYERPWVQRLIRQSLMPKGILVESHQDPAGVAVSGQAKRSFLFMKLPIFPPAVVDAVAGRLSFMFTKPALTCGALLFLASHLYVYGALIGSRELDFNRLHTGDVVLIMLLSTLATICHEFGHASAAAHYGCRRMTIGWGIYVIYTVLWTNVSEAWKLPRRQRAMVDVGGVYFESLFLVPLLAVYLWTDQAVLAFAFVFIDLAIVTTFNPFLRMDGYWLVSDLFGIVNLRQQQLKWIQEMSWKLFGRGPSPVQSDLSGRIKLVLGGYSAAGILFLGYLLFVISRFIVLNVATEYPTMLRHFYGQVVAGGATLDVVDGFFELFWRTLMLLAAVITLAGWARSAAGMVGRAGLLRAPARHGTA